MSDHTALQKTPTGYLALVSGNHNFRFLWLGQIISLLGDWFNLIASAGLIAQLTGSGLAVGGLFVVRMLAPFLISPFAGAWADRYNRRTLLIVADLLRAVTVLGFLIVRTPQQVWLLYTLTAVQLGMSGVFFPARNAILPDIVRREELGAANALSSTTWSVMLALGAALGGLAAGSWGIYPAFVIDSASFLLSALFISQVRYDPKAHGQHGAADGKGLLAALKQYTEGLGYLRQQVDTLAIALIKAAVALTVSGAFQVLQVAIAERIFVYGEGGAISLGAFYAVVGVGTGIGPIFARVFTGDNDRPMRTAILISFVITTAGLVLIATLQSFWVVLLGMTLRGFGNGINWVFSTQLLLQILPDRFRGRVFSTEFALFTLASAAASALGGWALDSSGLSISQVIWWLTGLSLLPALVWSAWIFKPESNRRGQAAS